MNAPKPVAPKLFQPRGLVSLWDMLRLHAENFSILSAWLAAMQMMYTTKNPTGDLSEQVRSVFDERMMLYLIDECKKGIIHCDKFGFNGTSKTLDLIATEADKFNSIVRHINVPDPFSGFASDLKNLFGEALRRLREDAEKHWFLQVQPERIHFYSLANVLKPETIRAFPKAEVSMKEAYRLYALEAHIGSIYHSMMALECGLPALAKVWGVTINPDKSTWGPIIGHIQTAIEKELAPHRPAGYISPLSALSAKKKKAVLNSSQRAAMEFRYFTNIWRNHIAHGRGSDDENDAKKCMDHVKDFMDILANDLKLKGS